MKISTSKSEVMVISQKSMECSLHLKLSLQNSLPVNLLYYFCGFHGKDIKMQPRLEWCPVYISFTSQSIFTQDHELWVMTKRIKSPAQVAQLRSHCSVAGLTLHDRVKSSMIWGSFGVQTLFLWIGQSQLRWFGHLARMPPGQVLVDSPSWLVNRWGIRQEERIWGWGLVWADFLSLLHPWPRPL